VISPRFGKFLPISDNLGGVAAKLDLERAPTISAMAIHRHGEAANVDRYLLPDHWCFHIYSYQAVLSLDGIAHKISPGDASLVPPGVEMTYRYSGPSEHVYYHFLRSSAEGKQALPMVLSLGSQYQSLDGRARGAVVRARSDPGFATAALWSLLWDYSDLATGRGGIGNSSRHPLVSLATMHIEQGLNLPLTVKTLCREVGVSYGYLTRLFTRELGVSVSEYIRMRRAEQAAHLLTSTSMPIKAIARSIGVPSLTHFNRLMHAAYGQGPRDIRSSQSVRG
jgi:AraC-like DNA-binding protein